MKTVGWGGQVVSLITHTQTQHTHTCINLKPQCQINRNQTRWLVISTERQSLFGDTECRGETKLRRQKVISKGIWRTTYQNQRERESLKSIEGRCVWRQRERAEAEKSCKQMKRNRKTPQLAQRKVKRMRGFRGLFCIWVTGRLEKPQGAFSTTSAQDRDASAGVRIPKPQPLHL